VFAGDGNDCRCKQTPGSLALLGMTGLYKRDDRISRERYFLPYRPAANRVAKRAGRLAESIRSCAAFRL
jgi:hypothetical protein